jgi:hypothetical protein
MGTKKSAVEELRGVQINVHLDKGVFQFMIGDQIKPDWNTVHTVMQKLYLLEYATDLLGSETVAKTLMVGSREQLEYYVPLLCRLINAGLETGKYEAALHPGLIGCAYVLAWYWYFNLQGPKPIYQPERHKTKVSLKIEWRCPVCNKEYDPPHRFVHIRPKYNAYIRWLERHGEEYHKEWED